MKASVVIPSAMLGLMIGIGIYRICFSEQTSGPQLIDEEESKQERPSEVTLIAPGQIDAIGSFFTHGFQVARSTKAVPEDSVSFKVVPLSIEEGGGVQLSWSSIKGKKYRIRRSDEWPEWRLRADDIEATPPINTLIDDEHSCHSFYQLNAVE